MRILVIEDERDVAALVKKAVSEQSHAVDIAYDGLEGQELALTEPYDLLILDIMLPRRDGLAVLERLRKDGIQTPVLMLTARGDVHDRVVGLDAGGMMGQNHRGTRLPS